MDADKLLELGTDPDAWLWKSRQLRVSADLLWEGFERAMTAWARTQPEQTDGSDESRKSLSYLLSAKLLYGLALETAFKAAIIRDRPSDVEFKMLADGKGKIHRVEMKQIGVAMGSGHDLTALGERVGVFTRGAAELFPADSDYEATRAILDELGEMVVWSGRYPIPVRSGESRTPPPTVPGVVYATHMRDWTDVILDRYHGQPAATDFDAPGV